MNTPHNLPGLTLWAVPRFRRQVEPIYSGAPPSLSITRETEDKAHPIVLALHDHRLADQPKAEM